MIMITIEDLQKEIMLSTNNHLFALDRDELKYILDRLQAAESTQEIINMLLEDISVDKNASIMDKLEALKRHWYFIARDAAEEEIEKLKAELHELRMQYISDFGQEQENEPIYQYHGAPSLWVDCDLKLYNLMEGKHRRIVYLQPAQSDTDKPLPLCFHNTGEDSSKHYTSLTEPTAKKFTHRFKNSMIGDQDAEEHF